MAKPFGLLKAESKERCESMRLRRVSVEERKLWIICSTIAICVAMVCGSAIFIHTQQCELHERKIKSVEDFVDKIQQPSKGLGRPGLFTILPLSYNGNTLPW